MAVGRMKRRPDSSVEGLSSSCEPRPPLPEKLTLFPEKEAQDAITH
jgi:hypothetical protein